MRRFLLAMLVALCAASASASALFENAKWIGADSLSLPFYADMLPIFQLETRLEKGDCGALVFGANDPRMLSREMNRWGVQARADSSYMAVAVNRLTGKAAVLRCGYTPAQKREVMAEYSFAPSPNAPVAIKVRVNLGKTEIYINGKKLGAINLSLNPAGGDYDPFPMLCQVGFMGNGKKKATFDDLVISNFREPGNVLARIPGATVKGMRLFRVENAGVPMLRTVLQCRKPIESATLAMAVRGIADAYGPKGRISPEYFATGSSQYDKTQYYTEYDITDQLTVGDNPVGFILGEGWWCGGATFIGENWNFFGDRPSVIAKVTVKYVGGDSLVYVTDPATWQVSTAGPVRYGSFFQGEVYDARREDANWLVSNSLPWTPAVEIPTEGTAVGDFSGLKFMPRSENRILPVEALTAKAVKEVAPGVYIYDLGQNIAGVPQITLADMPEGKQITLRTAEVLYPNLSKYSPLQGKLMTENLRMAQSRDVYTTKAGTQHYSPRFTYHGFRYIEVTGLDSPLPLSSVGATVISSMGAPTAGFSCSDSLVNKLWQNTLWSARANFMSVPTDCPQRNERLGWAGDISVFARTATYMANCNRFLYEYLRAMRDLQEPSGRYPEVAPTGVGFGGLLWHLAGITVPYEAYRQFGDIASLREHLPSMHRYMQYVENELIDSASNEIYQRRQWGDLGDWLSPEHDRNDKPLIWECYYIRALRLMQEMSRELGCDSLAAAYGRRAADRVRFFNKTYLDRKGHTIHGGIDPAKKGKLVGTQTSYALPLAFGIVDARRKNLVAKNFLASISRSNTTDSGLKCEPFGLFTGFIGTASVMEALSACNRPDYAYALLCNRSYPSWLYPITQGATTIWERLDSYTHTDGFGKNNSMNSFNHYSFGSVCAWLIEHCAGIRRHAAGNYTIEPTPDPTGALTWAEGYYLAPQGRISSRWQTNANGSHTYTVVVPAGLDVTLRLPGRQPIPLAQGSHTFTL